MRQPSRAVLPAVRPHVWLRAVDWLPARLALLRRAACVPLVDAVELDLSDLSLITVGWRVQASFPWGNSFGHTHGGSSTGEITARRGVKLNSLQRAVKNTK